MKFIVLLLSLVPFLKADDESMGGVSEEKKLKITDTLPTGNCTVKVQENDLVTFEAYGYTLDGKRFDYGQYQAWIGHDEAIKGVDQGLRGLCFGDERSLKIESEWAFGEAGFGTVAPNATVIYDVKVKQIDRDDLEGKRRGLKMNQFFTFTDANKVEDCGMKVQAGDKINWKYLGKLTDGTVFDKGDFSATIDKREVITGVNEAMKGLCVGGKREMLMHHSYAYGPRGTGNIPGYADLIFHVELYSIDRPGFGYEHVDTKLRKSSVTKEEPIKMTNIYPIGKCVIQGKEGDVATWFYHAYLLNGVLFDQGQAEGKIGSESLVPKGLSWGLTGLCVGDERSITLHPDVAHGEKGLVGKVPINATVIYDIHVLNIARTLNSGDAESTKGVDENTGLKPNQKLKIEIMHEISEQDCKIKSQEGDTLYWNYVGKFLDGTEFYRGEFQAVLGKKQVIPGVDRGMRDMCIGEKRQLTVHSDWAYGNEGRPGSIPPRATLVFDNELTNIERPTPPVPEEKKSEL